MSDVASVTWDANKCYIYLELGPGNCTHLYYDLPGIGKWEQVGPHDHPEMIKHLAIAFGALSAKSVESEQPKPYVFLDKRENWKP